MKFARIATALALAVMLAASASAQTKGKLRLQGKVFNEVGAPVEGAEVRAAMKGTIQAEPLATKTNNKGEWSIKDLAAGEWVIEAQKEGIGVAEATATLTDAEKTTTVNLTIKPRVDPNVELQEMHKQAIAFVEQGKPAEARKIWEQILEKQPTLYQFHGMIGAMYAEEKNIEKALEHLKIAVEKDPSNVEWQLLQGELMMEAGQKDEAYKILDNADMTKAREPRAFLNAAITRINSGDKAQANAATESLTKVIAHFPNEPLALYLRARAYIAAEKLAEAKADLEKYVAVAPPTAPQLADAKKLLEQLTKK